MAWRAGWSRRTRGVSRLCGALSLVVAAAAATQAELRSGLITAIEGEVTVDRAGHAAPLALERSDAVFVGDRIQTGHRSQARLSLGGDVELLVRDRTLLGIEPDERGHAITIQRGNVAALIRAAGAEIRAPNMIAHGTRTFVEIAVDGDSSGTENADTTICALHGWTRARALGGDAVTVGSQECATVVGNVWGPIRPITLAEQATVRGAFEKIVVTVPGAPGQAQIDSLRHACEGADPRACSDLGALSETRWHIRDPRSLAAEYYRRGCEAGDAFGCRALAMMYARGEGLPKRPARAADLYGRACGEGDAEACVGLAEMYEAGWARSPGAPPAAALYQRACDLGAVRACGP